METSGALALSRLICRVAGLQDEAEAAKQSNVALRAVVDELKQVRISRQRGITSRTAFAARRSQAYALWPQAQQAADAQLTALREELCVSKRVHTAARSQAETQVWSDPASELAAPT